MSHIRATLALVTGVFWTAQMLPSSAQETGRGQQVLESAARKYQEIDSYEYSATATRKLHSEFTAKSHLEGGYASPKMTPADLPVPTVSGTEMGLIGVFDRQGEPARLDLHSVAMPVLPSFDAIAWRVASAEVTGSETLQSHRCEIVTVHYEGNRRNPNNEPVRYWIDSKTKTVWKEQFSEVDPLSKNGELARWTVVWDSWTENQTPPKWLMDMGKSEGAKERPALIGREAPEIVGESLAGQPFRLSKLKGAAVVIDFWSTSCGPCSEQIATLEKLKASLAHKKVELWSVTEDRPSVAMRWMKERGRSLPCAIIPQNTAFKVYGVDVLPELVIVNPQGVVVHHWAGLKKETDLRKAIDELVSQ